MAKDCYSARELRFPQSMSRPFALVMATISAYLSGDGVKSWSLPLVILVLVAVSYFTRPPSRRLVGNTPT